MASSTLDPDFSRSPDRNLGKGHGTGSLGPSDTSDSGSDMQGGIGLSHDLGIGLDRGTTSDPEESTAEGVVGPDVGDADLDADSDSSGTGERAAAGRDAVPRAGRDIDTDRIVSLNDEDVDDFLDDTDYT